MVSFIGKNTHLSFDYHICDHVYVKTMELSTYYRFQHFVGKTRTVEISTFPEDAVFSNYKYFVGMIRILTQERC